MSKKIDSNRKQTSPFDELLNDTELCLAKVKENTIFNEISNFLKHKDFSTSHEILKYESFDSFRESQVKEPTKPSSYSDRQTKFEINKPKSTNNQEKSREVKRLPLRPIVKDKIVLLSADEIKSYELEAKKALAVKPTVQKTTASATITPPKADKPSTQTGITKSSEISIISQNADKPKTTPTMPISTPKPQAQKAITEVAWPREFKKPKPKDSSVATPSAAKTDKQATSGFKEWNYYTDYDEFNYTDSTGSKPAFGSGRQSTFGKATSSFGAKKPEASTDQQQKPATSTFGGASWQKPAGGFGSGKTTGFGAKTGSGFGAKAGAFGSKPTT